MRHEGGSGMERGGDGQGDADESQRVGERDSESQGQRLSASAVGVQAHLSFAAAAALSWHDEAQGERLYQQGEDKDKVCRQCLRSGFRSCIHRSEHKCVSCVTLCQEHLVSHDLVSLCQEHLVSRYTIFCLQHFVYIRSSVYIGSCMYSIA